MTSSNKTLIAALVVVGLGGLAIWDGSRKEKADKKADEATLLVPTEMSDINGITISTNKGQRIVLERVIEEPKKADPSKPADATPQSAGVGKWKMLEPLKDSADATTVESILSSVKTQKSRQVVSEGKDVNWAVFGLDHPVTTLVITSKSTGKVDGKMSASNSGSTKIETIEIGGVKAYDSSLYARVDHQDKVLLVGSEWDVLLSKLPREFRDKRLLRDRENLNFSKIEYTAKADGKKPALHLTLNQSDEKSGHVWTLDDGVEADKTEVLSDLAVKNYVSQIKAAHALNFINDDKKESGALKENGLLNPASVLKLTPDDKSPEIVLQFGPTEKGIANAAAVSTEIQPIVNVYASFLDALRKPAKDFFDKQAPFHFKVADVAKLQIQTKGSLAHSALDVELEKRGNEWRLTTKGLQKQIDNTKLNEMIQRISELEAVRFVQPIATVMKAHEPLPKKAKAGEAQVSNIGQMSNHIRLMRADGSLVLELKWGELLFEKSDVQGLSPEDAKLPGQVDAQFVATETNQSKWLMGVPEGSIRDLGVNQAVDEKMPDVDAALAGKEGHGAPAKVATPGAQALPKGAVPIQTPLPTPMANFEPVENKK